MLNKKMLKIVGLAWGLILAAGCQHQQEVAQQPAPAPEQPAAEQPTDAAEQNVIAVYLAQQNPNPAFIAVDLGEGKSLYALPKPVLTQADMQSVQSATTEQGQSFMVFELSEQGSKKLAEVSSQAIDHFFLFSAKGQLVGVSRINEPMSAGKLIMATENEEHSQQVLQLLR